MPTETVNWTQYDQGQQVDAGTITRALSPADSDQITIRQNIAAAKTALQNATATVNAATSTDALAALQQYAAANNQAWAALLPALKYIASRLSS